MYRNLTQEENEALDKAVQEKQELQNFEAMPDHASAFQQIAWRIKLLTINHKYQFLGLFKRENKYQTATFGGNAFT